MNVKRIVVTGHDFYIGNYNIHHLKLYVRPNRWNQNGCPHCNKVCPGYVQAKEPKVWRNLDFGGCLVEIESHANRIEVPWAFHESNFTKEFNLSTTWLATYLPRSVVSSYMRIDWATVGRCISRMLHVIEPARSRGLDVLVNIGIDETSYKKEHKYSTVIVNHDTNTVVWASQGHGKTVLEKFYRTLTPEQLASIKIVTGDDARWITECVHEFTPEFERRVDHFMLFNGLWKL